MRLFFLSCWLLPVIVSANPLQRGLEAKAAGDFELATRELAAAVKAEPKNTEAWMHYGTVLGWQKKYDEALAALDKGLEISPKDYDLRMAHGRVVAWQGNYGKASEEFDALAKDYPDSEEIMVMRGRIATWTGNLDKAEEIYQKVIARNPNQVDALTGLGDVAYERRKLDEAEVYFNRAFEIDPSPDIKARLERLDDESIHRIDAGITASSFAGGGRSDWWSYWTQYSEQTALGVFWGRVEQGERFDEQDTVLEIGWEGNFINSLQSRVIVGASPDAFWAPNWYVETDALWTPDEKFPSLIVEFKYAEYEPRGVFTSRLGLEQSFGEGRKASLKWVHQEYEGGDPTDGWILALHKEYDSGYGFVMGMAQGAETLDGQSLTAANVLKSKTYFAGIRGPINDRWGWRADIEFEDYDTGANRRGVSLGAHCKF